MNKVYLSLLIALLFGLNAAVGGVFLENEPIRVTVDSNGTLTVVDKRSATEWKQAIPEEGKRYPVGKISKTNNSISFEVNAGQQIRVTLKLNGNEPDVLLELSAVDSKGSMPENIAYPYPFLPPSKDAELVIPNRSGALYPVTERVFGPKPWHVGGKELMMSWYGIVDEKLESGVITVIDTPHDSEMIIAAADGYVMPMIEWMPSMRKFGYDRKMIYHFSSKGGYVPLAKYYRNYKIQTGEFITLREKVQQNPEVAKLIGGINARIIHNYEGLSPEYLTRLPEYGITKGSLCLRAKDDEDGIITDEIVDKLTGQGFLLTHWCTKKWVVTKLGHPLHPQYMEDPNLVLTEDMSSFSKSELKGKGSEGGMKLLCDTSCYDRLDQFVERCRTGYPLKPEGFSPTGSLKIDTLCGDIYECYDPEHPLTRGESVALRVETLKKFKEQGFVLSAEGGDDWGVPYLDTAYGPLALQRSQGRKIATATWGIKYPVDPQIGPQYDEYYFGPQHRVPLFDLVYHDCIVTTFHDGDSNNMYYKTIEEDKKYWRLKELFQVLHGQAPNFYLTVDDFFLDQHERIKESIETVCTWHEQVAYDELVDHRYLTKDRMVQESRFSSGRSVIVNFSPDETFVLDSQMINSLDFLTTRWK